MCSLLLRRSVITGPIEWTTRLLAVNPTTTKNLGNTQEPISGSTLMKLSVVQQQLFSLFFYLPVLEGGAYGLSELV